MRLKVKGCEVEGFQIAFLILIRYLQVYYPDSRLPTPVPLLGGVRGGFRLPTPYNQGLSLPPN
ncbi:hypothetical protein [Moorena sp. SIO4G3]|uniref:hypothetical protein n=1 Tax=Moorena sp. SIO4G3 TaxID=2607821 RepID=UPI00142A7685|nr:hypothetical protein [Moorena sp. SIO4G3]NEO75165.1 hypothetical protein [Moorena sp. SIO4G3]